MYFESPRAAAQYGNEVKAVYKQMYLEANGNDEAALKEHMNSRFMQGARTQDFEQLTAELVVDNEIPWETVESRAYARRVSGDTLQSLRGCIEKEATERLLQADDASLTNGMLMYAERSAADNALFNYGLD